MPAFTLSQDRSFTGIANSGKPFSHYGTPTIIDLSSVSFHDRVPALLLHDRQKRVGFGTLSVMDGQLVYTGKLLDNDDANAIAKDADAGFPWQMSVHISAQRTIELSGNETMVVNGQTLHAPLTILQGGHISEVSFTPTGVDHQTSAVVLSDDPHNPNHKATKEQPMSDDLKAINAELTAQNDELTKEIDVLKTTNAELTAQIHTSNVVAALSEKGFKKDEQGNYQGLDDGVLDVLLSLDIDKAKVMIASLSAPKHVPDYLLSEQSESAAPQANPLLERLAQNKANYI